jgi:hypothetical protein
VVGAFVAACDDEQQPAKPEADTPVATASTAKPPAPPRMPEVTLHTKAVQMGMDELVLTAPSFDVSLINLLKKYPVAEPDIITFNIDRKVKTPLATKVFYALIDAGAKSIEVRTKPRGSFPDKLVITPQTKLGGDVPACTLVGTIMANLGATFWRVRGGTAKRYTKGMAGPDLSAMHEVMFKEGQTCNSTLFLFSAEDDVDWGHAFDIATSVKAHDPPYPIDKFVLLREDPVPGKPIPIKP